MSIVKTSVTLAIGAVLGVALKCAKDFNDSRKAVVQLNAKYRARLETYLPRLMAEALLAGDDAAKDWEQGISEIVYGRFFTEIDSSLYPLWVKEQVGEELDALYRDFKEYRYK